MGFCKRARVPAVLAEGEEKEPEDGLLKSFGSSRKPKTKPGSKEERRKKSKKRSRNPVKPSKTAKYLLLGEKKGRTRGGVLS